MQMITLSLPEDLLAQLPARPDGSKAIREAMVQGLDAGLRGGRRRRHSATTCRQTSLLVPQDLYERLVPVAVAKELSTFAELALRVYLDRQAGKPAVAYQG